MRHLGSLYGRTSPLFHDIEFNERFRGHDVDEVDAYVDRVAKAAAMVQGRIAELQERPPEGQVATGRPVPTMDSATRRCRRAAPWCLAANR